MDLQRILNTPPRGPYPGTPIQTAQDSQSINSPLAPSTPIRHRHSDETSRDLRLMIQTALLFKRPYKEICQVLGVTEYQIRWAKTHRLTPQKARRLRPKLCTPQRRRLEEWLLASPSHRRIPWRYIPNYLPELDAKEDAIYTAFKELGYCRRTSKKKGFSDNECVLSYIQSFLQEHVEEGYIFMQDNAPSHRSYETKINLLRRRIPYIKFPPYSPDLNLIEHVWNWMKNWIQERYWEVHYRVDRIPLPELKRIIWEAWEAVPDSYIQSLYDSWWRRCQAVIDANGGPTKY